MGLTKKLVMAVLPLFSLMAVGEEVEPLYSKHDYIKGKVMILTNTEEWVAGKLSSVSGEIAAIWEEMSHLPTGEGLAKVAKDATNYTDAVAVETKGYADGVAASIAEASTNYTDTIAVSTKEYAAGLAETASSDATNYTDSVASGIRADIPMNTAQLVNNGDGTDSNAPFVTTASISVNKTASGGGDPAFTPQYSLSGGAIAVGRKSRAYGIVATAVGFGSTAGRENIYNTSGGATALGSGASAPGALSVAVGRQSQAYSQNSVAIGFSANAGTEWFNTEETKIGAVAIGDNAKAHCPNAIAIGPSAPSASFTNAIAIGASAVVTKPNAIQFGRGTNNTEGSFQVYDFPLLTAEGKVPIDRLPPIEAGLTTNDVSSIVSNITDGAFLSTTGGVVTGKTTLDGLTEILDLTVTSDTSLQGNLTVVGNSDLGNTSISTLSISESATLASAEVSDNLTVSGTTYLEGTTYLNGRTYVEDTIRIDGDMYLNDQKVDLNDYVPVNNGTATNLMVSNLTVAGNFAPTNGFVTSSVTNGLIGADAISTNNPAFVKAVTNCPIAVLNGEGKVPLDMLPPIDAGLKTNNVEDLIDENLSTNNPSFVAAVTNCPVVVDSSYGDFAGYGTIGTLLAALVAAIALLRKKKADAETLADEFDATKAYSKEEYVTHDGKLYRFNAAHTAGAWTGTDVDEIQVTAPDATVDVGSDNRLRVVDAEANILWSQGYQLADESSNTLSCDKVNLISLADGTTTLSLALPTVPAGVVGDFIVDIDNSQNASDVACEIADLTAMKISVVLMDGDDLNDLLTFTANTMYELYFTQTAFAIDGKPTWKVMRQVVVSGNPSTGS